MCVLGAVLGAAHFQEGSKRNTQREDQEAAVTVIPLPHPHALLTWLPYALCKTTRKRAALVVESTALGLCLPVHHHRDPFPRPKRSHVL